MATGRREWTQQMVQYVQDHGPSPFEEVLSWGMKFVPPARAVREVEIRYRNSSGDRERTRYLEDTEKFRSGARSICYKSLMALNYRRKLSFEPVVSNGKKTAIVSLPEVLCSPEAT